MPRSFFPAGLSQMHFVPHPFGVPLAALTRIGLIGRNDPLSILDCGTIPKADQPVDPLEMLVPHLLQEDETWANSNALGGLLVQRCLQEIPALFSHLSAQEFFRLLAFGKALQLKAMHRAIKPV